MTTDRLKGTIMKSLSGFYYVALDGKENSQPVECRARGLFRQREIKPCVGDFVEIEMTDNGKGSVMEIAPRNNSLVRPPLANLDQLILVVSIAKPPPNLFVLDKLIAISEFQQIEPVIVVTKADLKDTTAFAETYIKAGFRVHTVCSTSGSGVEAVKAALKGKTSAFCGNSGAGKSTLLNAIDSRLRLDTADISHKLGRGKHTTRQVELFEMEGGGFVADTPGFSSVDLEKFQTIRKQELETCFREFDQFLGQCKYVGCSHTKENGCAVLEAVKNGEIAQTRHQSYTALYELAMAIKDWERK